MINPFSAAVLPIPSAPTQQRGKDQGSSEDFRAWLDRAEVAAKSPEAEAPAKPRAVSQAPAEGRLDAEADPRLGCNFTHDLPAQTGQNDPRPTAPNSELPLVLDSTVRPGSIADFLAQSQGHLAGSVAAATAAAVDVVTDAASIGAGGEHVDFVSVLWHLHANAGLSYRTVNGGELQASAGRITEPGAPPTTAIGRAEAREARRDARIEQREERLQSLTMQSQLRATRREEVRVGALDAAAQRAGWAPLLTWPQRMLRWLGDGEGTTAWVRDYQLDPSNAKTLLDSLRCLAEQQGLPLRRIMLNGHELWRSPSTP